MFNANGKNTFRVPGGVQQSQLYMLIGTVSITIMKTDINKIEGILTVKKTYKPHINS